MSWMHSQSMLYVTLCSETLRSPQHPLLSQWATHGPVKHILWPPASIRTWIQHPFQRWETDSYYAYRSDREFVVYRVTASLCDTTKSYDLLRVQVNLHVPFCHFKQASRLEPEHSEYSSRWHCWSGVGNVVINEEITHRDYDRRCQVDSNIERIHVLTRCSSASKFFSKRSQEKEVVPFGRMYWEPATISSQSRWVYIEYRASTRIPFPSTVQGDQCHAGLHVVPSVAYWPE